MEFVVFNLMQCKHQALHFVAAAAALNNDVNEVGKTCYIHCHES